MGQRIYQKVNFSITCHAQLRRLYSVFRIVFFAQLQNAFMNDCFFIHCKIRNQNNKKAAVARLVMSLALFCPQHKRL